MLTDYHILQDTIEKSSYWRTSRRLAFTPGLSGTTMRKVVSFFAVEEDILIEKGVWYFGIDLARVGFARYSIREAI